MTARQLPPAPGRLIDVGTHRLHLNCSGSGSPAVVFESALGASSLSWSLVLPAVSQMTRACAYDRGGFGWSEAAPLPRTAGRIADELAALLEGARVPHPCVLIGHSFGALVIQLLAARHPTAAAALVLIEPAPPADWVAPSDEQRKLIARGTRLCRHGATAARLGIAQIVAALVGVGALGAARNLARLVSRGGLRREDEGILAPVGKLPPGTGAVLKRMWTQPRFFEALGSQIESMCDSAAQVMRETPDSYGDLPLVVMTAATADARRHQMDADLARRSRHGRHIIVPDSGHWIPLDAPHAVVNAIGDVVRMLRGRL